MKPFDLAQGLVIPEDTDLECHIWLDAEDARELARHFINADIIFSYLPQFDGSVEIVADISDIAMFLWVEFEVVK